MVLYECNYCIFKTKLKTDYSRHTKTKKHRVNSGDENADLEGTTPNSQNDPKMTTNDHEMTTNDHEMTTNDNVVSAVICVYCDKEFTSKAHKRRHELHHCIEIPSSDMYKQDKIEWRKEKKVLYKQIDALIKKAGNTTTNHMNLNSYGKEDLSHITDSFKTGLLKGPYGMIPKMIEAVHFNDNKPENKNISLTNKKENRIKVFKNGKWEYCKKSEILDDIMHNNYYLLDSHYDDIGKDILNNVQNLQYSGFKTEFKNGNLDKNTKEDIDLVLLNGE
jgi:hypothetical protein